MTANQIMLDILDIPFNTRNLFTKNFLLNRLPKHPIWKYSIPEAEKAREEILKIYNENKSTLSKILEEQLENDFIRKVFDILGHKNSYAVQVPLLMGFGKFKKPDYVFFKNEETKKKADEIRIENSERLYSLASGVGKSSW